MSVAALSESPPVAPALADVEELHGRYASYRRRQAARLVHMLPRAAIRPLYRRACAVAAREEAAGATAGDGDPLALLMWFCERLLPLPPFAVWCEDLARSPSAHFADVEDSMDGPTADAPSTMEARAFEHRGRTWLARLRAYRDGGLWRGHIAFEERTSGRVHRTAPVFCEQDAEALRERFLSFDSAAFAAFLRSALP